MVNSINIGIFLNLFTLSDSPQMRRARRHVFRVVTKATRDMNISFPLSDPLVRCIAINTPKPRFPANITHRWMVGIHVQLLLSRRIPNKTRRSEYVPSTSDTASIIFISTAVLIKWTIAPALRMFSTETTQVRILSLREFAIPAKCLMRMLIFESARIATKEVNAIPHAVG
jgi:hypothetical protein